MATRRNPYVRFGPIADIDHVSHFEAKKETALVAISPKSGQALCSGGGGLSVGLQEGQ
jgi:hypothetical protein